MERRAVLDRAVSDTPISSSLVFLDSNVFIYSQVERLPECKLAQTRIAEIKSRSELGINAIFVSECFYILNRFLGSEDASKRVSLFLDSSRVQYLSIEKATLTKSMKLAVEKKQRRINDMILAQHALDSKADGIFTDNVKHFEGISGLNVIGLRR